MVTHMPKDIGWIEVICGSMFSGKTEELIRRIKRAAIAHQQVQVFKPKLDDRYHETNIVSHDARMFESTIVDLAEEILQHIRFDTDVVGIDEAQFFDKTLVSVCETLANAKKRVIVAGLDQNYKGEPFHPIPELLAIAEDITKCMAICVRCGNLANRSYRISQEKGNIVVGAKDKYEARCLKCFLRGD